MELIRKNATLYNLSAKRLLNWRLSEKLSGNLMYLYWRNRFPFLNKIVSRLLVLFEIYLISIFFHLKLAASLALVIIIQAFYLQLHKGFLQVGRMRILELLQKRSESNNIKKYYAALLRFSINSGLILSLATALLLYLFGQSKITVAFAVCWILILPFQFASMTSWMAVYTMHRHRQSFLVNLVCEALPILFLLLFHNELGIYSYFAGYAIGKTTLSFYLHRIASATLFAHGFVGRLQMGKARKAKLDLKSYLLIKDSWKHLSSLVSMELYAFALCIMLYFYSQNYFITHFIFLSLLFFSTYPVIRSARTYAMDYFLSHKSANPLLAEIFMNKALKASRAVMCIEGTIFLILICAISYYFGIINTISYKLAPYLIALFICHSIIKPKLNFLALTGSNKYLSWKLSVIYIAIGLPLQAYLIFYERSNLQAVYLLEILISLIVIYCLKDKGLFKKSPLSIFKFKYAEERGLLLPLDEISGVTAKQSPSGSAQEIAILLIHERYKTSQQQESLLSELCSVHGISNFINICPRVYVVFRSACNLAEDLLKFHPYHIRNAISVKKEDCIMTVLKTLIKPIPLRTVPELLAQFKNWHDKYQSELCDIINLNGNITWRHCLDFLSSKLGQESIEQLGVLYIDASGVHEANRPSREFADKIREFLSKGPDYTRVLKSPPAGTGFFQGLGPAAFAIDIKNAPPVTADYIRGLAASVSLFSTLKFLVVGDNISIKDGRVN